MIVAKKQKALKKIRNALMKLMPPKRVDTEMSYYQEIPEETTWEDLEKNGFGVWQKFEELDKEYTRPKYQTRYEIFVSGFLYYFEKHVKESKQTNRTVYFDWCNINQKAALTIFLKPFYGNPRMTGSTNTSSDMKGNDNGEFNGFNKHEELEVLTNTLIGKMQSTAIAPPPTEGGTDPELPPKPPPPTQE